MRLHLPTPEQIVVLASRLHMSFTRGDAQRYRGMMAGILDAYRTVEQEPDDLPPVRYPRTPGRRPGQAENRLGAWTRRLQIDGAADGPLAGLTVAIKDVVMVSGVPMNAGTRFLDHHVAEIDATIVTRILDAGGTIIGKTACEYLCLSGGSHTGFPGPVHSPWRYDHSAGGSSSGSAVVVATGEADMAIGTDQGGSIRIPASWCGVVGLKPTYGLVPYTGILPIEFTLDHAGPLTRTVRENAILLGVLAGHDPLDPRQESSSRAGDYLARLEQGVAGLRVGIVKEGFGWPASEAAVDECVREQAHRLATMGAVVEELSVPLHRIARDLWTPLFIEGCLDLMMRHNGAGTNRRGLFVTSASDALARWRQHGDELSPSMKVVMLAAEHLSRNYNGRYYGKSQNLMRKVTAAYDDALERYDVLLMPTTPMKAQPLPPADADDDIIWEAALGMNINTAPSCSTGHPSISLPCGMVEGLPVGMMMIGRHFDEETLYRAARACEAEFCVGAAGVSPWQPETRGE